MHVKSCLFMLFGFSGPAWAFCRPVNLHKKEALFCFEILAVCILSTEFCEIDRKSSLLESHGDCSSLFEGDFCFIASFLQVLFSLVFSLFWKNERKYFLQGISSLGRFLTQNFDLYQNYGLKVLPREIFDRTGFIFKYYWFDITGCVYTGSVLFSAKSYKIGGDLGVWVHLTC